MSRIRKLRAMSADEIAHRVRDLAFGGFSTLR